MKTIIDEDAGVVVVRADGAESRYPIGSSEGFAAVSSAWLRSGWDAKHVYSFTWLGRPIIQLPEDMIRIQELIYRLKPDVVLETGIAHGGSLVFYASILKLIGRGRVIGIDLDIREHNRKALEAHDLIDRITLIEGDSTAYETYSQVKTFIKPGETVLVILDSHHSRDHVLKELTLYSSFVTVGSYAVATDGIMQQMKGAPRSSADWDWNNPKQAAHDFVAEHDDFVMEEPSWDFNEGSVTRRVTYWPDAYLRRVK